MLCCTKSWNSRQKKLQSIKACRESGMKCTSIQSNHHHHQFVCRFFRNLFCKDKCKQFRTWWNIFSMLKWRSDCPKWIYQLHHLKLSSQSNLFGTKFEIEFWSQLIEFESNVLVRWEFYRNEILSKTNDLKMKSQHLSCEFWIRNNRNLYLLWFEVWIVSKWIQV